MSGPGDGATFSFQAIAPEDVFKRLSTLNVRKAPGIDGICHCLLKNCAQALDGQVPYAIYSTVTSRCKQVSF